MVVVSLVDFRLELAKGLVVVLETVPVVLGLVLVRVPGKAEAIERSLEACCRWSPSGDFNYGLHRDTRAAFQKLPVARFAFELTLIDHYITAVIYPDGLTRNIQMALGVSVLIWNLLIYALVVYRTTKRRSDKRSDRVNE